MFSWGIREICRDHYSDFQVYTLYLTHINERKIDRYPFNMTQWHAKSTDEVLAHWQVDPKKGLTSRQVQQYQQQYGKNILKGKAGIPAWKRLLLQFHNPLIYILLVATVITFLLGHYVDSAVIFGVVIINAFIGYIQEAKAEDAIRSLQQMVSSTATVLRDGKRQVINATEIVPADIVFFTSGDKVPADMRLVEVKNLQVNESALTGESVASQKAQSMPEAKAVLGDRSNMAYAGTLVTYGQAIGVVCAIAHQTEMGKIADMLRDVVSLDTPLTRKIHHFSKILLWIILSLAGITVVVGLLYGEDPVDLFMSAVALSVAAIPEGLPAVVTITLAIGVRRMASRNAIIRKLPAVETLGSTKVICSDKTGTLTRNEMTVQQCVTASGIYQLTGVGYAPEGALEQHNKPFKGDDHSLAHLLQAGVLCNDSQWVEKAGRWQIEGDPTEGALYVSASKAGMDLSELAQHFQRVDSIPFESDRQYMATLHRSKNQSYVMYMKGSVERVLARCDKSMDAQGRKIPLDHQQIESQVAILASQGLRVLAFAMSETTENKLEDDPKELVFIGLQAMIDPPREEVISAVRKCHHAGIKVKMITGDHGLTATAIAQKIGIIQSSVDSKDFSSLVLTGQQLSEMDDAELLQKIDHIDVFARVAPEQKLRLVNMLQSKGHIVAMTGDGVNDAPALKQADIGIAMGITGTEVSKEAADMILTDDNFTSIQAAVEEGRTVFDNLLKFITWILPTNIGQGLVIMLAILIGSQLPVLPVQALWLNMTTAVFLGLMLAFEPKERGIMNRSPRLPKAPLLSLELMVRVITLSTFLLIGAFGLFEYAKANGASIEEARTLAVTLFVIVQSFFLINCRSLRKSIFEISWFSNLWVWLGIAVMILAQLAFIYTPTMQLLFNSDAISFGYWLVILSYGIIVMLLIEVEKSLWRLNKYAKQR